jgi:probable phosphoglycerate mutase
MIKNKLYFVRHGENLANLRRMLSSRIVDFSLTERGQLQAKQTAEYFRAYKIDMVYASPLKRAIETPGDRRAARERSRAGELREVHTGELENRRTARRAGASGAGSPRPGGMARQNWLSPVGRTFW